MVPQEEFSRPVALEPWAEGGHEIEVVAQRDERAALARRFELLALDELSAWLRLERDAEAGVLRLSGRLVARLAQACVVSLEPVWLDVDQAVLRRYRIGEAAQPRPGQEVFVDPDDDAAETLAEPVVDLGVVVAEELALALPPYPRAADAEEELRRLELGDGVSVNGDERGDSPFAALRGLVD